MSTAIAKAWIDWRASEEGEQCANIVTLPQLSPQYLENRLHLAFMAGIRSTQSNGANPYGVEVGQVYLEKDKRMFNRHVKVISINGPRARCANCRPDGSLISERTTRISLKNLSTRFILITP